MTYQFWFRKIFRNKFSRFVNKQKKNKEGQKPSLLLLEDRLVPAVPFVQTPFGANIQAIWSGPDNAQGKFTENPTFRVTFNYPVTGVDVGDFNINVVHLVPDSGADSLRQAIDDANPTPGNNQVNFRITSTIMQLRDF